MEGVGARTGRTSTRYGPATVFNGPVRKWKKKWVHVAPPSHSNHSHSHQINGLNGTPNGNNGSHLLLFKWAPITHSQNAAAIGNNTTNGDNKDTVEDVEEPPRRRFKYIPVIGLVCVLGSLGLIWVRFLFLFLWVFDLLGNHWSYL